ncbi:uncharacterized protein C7orf57 homolog [Aplochiton taeniatus]
MAELSTAPNHRRTKPGGIKPAVPSNGAVGPTSQIPGLSQSANNSAPEERTSGRRVGIFDSDSEYVKLAKQGGQKGLLSHEDLDEAEPRKAYTPSDWFVGSQGSKSASNATSPDGGSNKGPMQPLAAPFGTDNCSSWGKENDSLTTDKEKQAVLDSAAAQMKDLSVTHINKYKRTAHVERCQDKKAPPVSMSKLLSFGYVEDETKSPNDDDTSSKTLLSFGYVEDETKSPNDDDTSSVTSEQLSTIATEDVDYLE